MEEETSSCMGSKNFVVGSKEGTDLNIIGGSIFSEPVIFNLVARLMVVLFIGLNGTGPTTDLI